MLSAVKCDTDVAFLQGKPSRRPARVPGCMPPAAAPRPSILMRCRAKRQSTCKSAPPP